MSEQSKIHEAAAFIRGEIDLQPQIGLILGSGLGVLADLIEKPIVIDYSKIPHFPVSTVEGHAGELVVGSIQNKQVLIMKGRFHAYEGYGAQIVSFPVRVMKELGIHTLMV